MGKKNILLIVFLLFAEICVAFIISYQYLTKNIIIESCLNVSSSSAVLTEDYVREKLGLSEASEIGTDGTDAGETQLPQLYKGGDSGDGTRVAVAEATESSSIFQEGKDNTAYAAIDGDLRTSWQEGSDGPGEGEWISFRLQEVYAVRYLTFYLGNWNDENGQDYYSENNRPAKLRLTLGDHSWDLEFPDEKIQYRLELASPVETDQIRVEILSVYEGTRWDEACIADIGIYY